MAPDCCTIPAKLPKFSPIRAHGFPDCAPQGSHESDPPCRHPQPLMPASILHDGWWLADPASRLRRRDPALSTAAGGKGPAIPSGAPCMSGLPYTSRAFLLGSALRRARRGRRFPALRPAGRALAADLCGAARRGRARRPPDGARQAGCCWRSSALLLAGLVPLAENVSWLSASVALVWLSAFALSVAGRLGLAFHVRLFRARCRAPESWCWFSWWWRRSG